MNIVAVVGLRWISRSARLGAPSVTLWILACLVFFVPLAAVIAELSSRHPQQGGIYAWARRAFGPAHGFVCGWCMWVNNLFYFPSLLLFAGANMLVPLGPDGAAIADSRWYSVTFVLGFLWLTTFLNILGFSAGKWIQHIGSVATWVPAVLLVAAGAIAFATLGSATSFAPSELIPRDNFMDTMSLWSSLCFAFSGFEISSMVGQEVYDPRKTIPRSIVLSGIAITAIYILSSASVLVAVPASELAERSGIADAVELVGSRLGFAGVGAFIGLLLFVGSIGGTSSWIAGAARVPFAAGVDAAMPAAFARLHPTYRTPHVALSRAGDRHHGVVSRERVPLRRRRHDDDPGGLRHHGEPHHPDLLPAVPVSVCVVHSAAIAGQDDAGRREHDRAAGRVVRRLADRRMRARRDVDRDGIGVCPADRNRKRSQL
jgi:amino acid transporter